MGNITKVIVFLIWAEILGGLVYAVCVIWPLKFNPTTGLVLGGLAGVAYFLVNMFGLVKRLRRASKR